MSDFGKTFLLEDARRLNPNGRFVALAAFGKHPGWDDHVEDLGLETESLNLAKTVLYVNGIGGQIDSGAWEKLDAAQQFPAFKHVFVWQRSGQILIGRLWSSSDGKGRKRYPMVVCLQFAGVTLDWALKQALPALAELEEGCLKASSADEVRGLLNRKRAALREAIQSTDGLGEYAPVMPEALHTILQTADGAPPEGFLRVLYQMQSQLVNFNTRANPAAARAQQFRVPVAGDNPGQALLFWTRFFLTHVDASVPLLLTLPLEAGWMDVTAGEPESHEFFSLRASPKAVPLVSEVPYTLDEAFRVRATAFLKGFQRGETTTAAIQPAGSPAAGAVASTKGGWWKWIGIGPVVIIGAVAALVWLPKGGGDSAGNNAAKPVTDSPTPGAKNEAVPAVDAAKAEAMRAETAKAEADQARARMAAAAEATRLAEEKQKSDALAAAAKLKSDTEAASKQKELQMAEAARQEKERLALIEKEAARQRELGEQKRMADEAAAAKKKTEEEKMRLAAAPSASKSETRNPASAPVATAASLCAAR